jgi:hypothetical protein
MFNNSASLKESLPSVAAARGIKNIVIAAHGDRNGIFGARSEYISRAVLSHTMYRIDRDIEGLFFGCCLVGRKRNAEFLLYDYGHPKGIQVKWIAGYQKTAHWLRSAAFELLFWTTYYQEVRKKGSMKQRMGRVAKQMHDLAGGLVDDLGFSLYVRKRGTKPGSGEPRVEDVFERSI